jgi:ParE toxin of type II toxin-antitoxin system, parDE
MNVRRTDLFIADIERQYQWYATNADWEVADRYLDAIEGTCHLLSLQPAWVPRVDLPTHSCNRGGTLWFFGLSANIFCFMKFSPKKSSFGGPCTATAIYRAVCWKLPAKDSSAFPFPAKPHCPLFQFAAKSVACFPASYPLPSTASKPIRSR